MLHLQSANCIFESAMMTQVDPHIRNWQGGFACCSSCGSTEQLAVCLAGYTLRQARWPHSRRDDLEQLALVLMSSRA